MRIRQFTSATRSTINWAGGTSTEIFIFPPEGSFAARDFLFRISTATVEIEESTFTFFEGITRHLMILKGELKLVHEGRYTKHLKPFDQDTFSGGWPTRSKGKVTDFNLMLKSGATGALKHHALEAGNSILFTKKADFCFIYMANGKGLAPNNQTVNTGDLVWLENEPITLTAPETCDVIEIAVYLPDSES